MKDGERVSSETIDSPPKSGSVLAKGIINIAITIRAAINGGGKSRPCLSCATKYAITATNPEIDSHKNALVSVPHHIRH